MNPKCITSNAVRRPNTFVPSHAQVTGVQQHRQPTASGLNDYDYQDLATLTRNDAIQLNQIESVGKVPIPPEIMEHFKHIKCHCMMGLFPEIGRAWLTIDSDLYVSSGSADEIEQQ